MGSLSRLWDRQLEHDLPECRLHPMARGRDTLWVGGLKYEQVYCGSCGVPGGRVFADNDLPFVHYVCDGCYHKMAAPEKSLLGIQLVDLNHGLVV